MQRIEKKIRQNVYFLKFDYKVNKNIKNNLRLSFIKKVLKKNAILNITKKIIVNTYIFVKSAYKKCVL